MKLRTVIIAALLAPLLAGPAHAAVTPGEAEVLRRDSERGRLIYALDQAGWVSSDELVKRFPDPHAAGIRGYVVEPAADGMLRATYYRLHDITPLAAFVVDIRDGKVVDSRVIADGQEVLLSPVAIRMIGARNAAAAAATAQGLHPCAQAGFNSVILPPVSPDGPISVYLLTPQIRTGDYPFGGHFEFDVAANGSILSSRAFTKSCITIGRAQLPHPDDKPVASVVTHLLDPTPTEIHVYLSLWMKQPVYVSTEPNRMWIVDGDRIGEANK